MGLFLCIFVIFKLKFYRKTRCQWAFRTRIVGVEGENAAHLTTTTALINYVILTKKLSKLQLKKSALRS